MKIILSLEKEEHFRIAEKVQDYVDGWKVNHIGWDIVAQSRFDEFAKLNHFSLRNKKEVFFDCKLWDTPNTVKTVVERIIEWVGLKEGEGKFWDKQKTFGNSQPDFTFYFPNGAYVHLDSKFPFDNYLEMIKCNPNSPEEESVKKTFESNVKAILKKIYDAREDYIEHDGGINFVMIFVPNMQVLNFVREEYDDLYNNASKKKMLFVGPSELYSILHILKGAVENFRVEQSTKEIINNMKKFQLEWDNMLSEFDKHGKQLKTAQGSFDDIIGPRKRALEKIVDKITSSDSSDDKE